MASSKLASDKKNYTRTQMQVLQEHRILHVFALCSDLNNFFCYRNDLKDSLNTSEILRRLTDTYISAT